jgi:hypothetical protein
VIEGTAYGHPATLEVNGKTLVWRAQQDVARENIVTTIHDVRLARWIVLRHTWAGFAIAALGVVWLWRDDGWFLGLGALAAAGAWMTWRAARPRRFLVLEVGTSRLVLEVAASSAAAARALVTRIDRVLDEGELPTHPPMLP